MTNDEITWTCKDNILSEMYGIHKNIFLVGFEGHEKWLPTTFNFEMECTHTHTVDDMCMLFQG